MPLAGQVATLLIGLLPELIKVLRNALKHDDPKAALKRAAAVIAVRKATSNMLNAALRRRRSRPVRK